MEPSDVKKPSLKVLRYRHDPKYRFVIDLRGFGQGRKFFKTRAEAEAERLRQKTTLERHGQEAIGLSQRDLSDFITGKKKLAQYRKTEVPIASVALNLPRTRSKGVNQP